ncbi:MAG: hypothetical protein V4498_01560 [candidate division FCPU426 bacterium]
MGKLKRSPTKSVAAKAKDLLRAAEEVLLEGSTMAAGFEDAEDFKVSLLKALEDSEAFNQAAHAVHSSPSPVVKSSSKAANMSLKTKDRKPGVKVTGRVQASRLQPRGNER